MLTLVFDERVDDHIQLTGTPSGNQKTGTIQPTSQRLPEEMRLNNLTTSSPGPIEPKQPAKPHSPYLAPRDRNTARMPIRAFPKRQITGKSFICVAFIVKH